tara:strand:+ start:7523 stop:7831 length:309 start_codon:yes stop_codon:yes gene_type:complete
MEITGKLIKKLDIEGGVSKAGKEWQRQSILIEQNADFNKEVVIGFFGDKIQKLRDIQEGLDITVMVNVYSREFKGKYYHSIDGYWISQGAKENTQDNEDMPF